MSAHTFFHACMLDKHMALSKLSSALGFGSSGGNNEDLEELASIDRAPPMPMESVRRIVAAVLQKTNQLTKVEDFLARQGGGMSLYNGRSSYFDILMAVFPIGKPLKVSRAAFASVDEAKAVARLLSWAATFERWASEYEQTRKMIDSPDRASPFALLRASQFKTAAAASAKPFGDPAEIKYNATGSKKYDDWAAVAVGSPVVDDPLITLTKQVLWCQPFIWHRELDPNATLEDPVIFTVPAGTDSTADGKQRANDWSILFTTVVAKSKTPAPTSGGTTVADIIKAADQDLDTQNLYNTVVYVDGASLTAGGFVELAINQLLKEVGAMYPAAGGAKFRRGGVCPAGEQYIVKVGGAEVPKGPLDAAIRAALRKYGKIDSVSVVCGPSSADEFKVVPVTGSSVW